MKIRFIYSFIIAGLLFIAVTGQDCSDILLGGGGINDSTLAGTSWQLDRVTGALQDICPGETVDFGSSTADLTCPGSGTITRNYSLNNLVLTYTQSGVTYQVDSLNSSRLVLRGQNVSRNLYYNRIITTTNPPAVYSKSAGKNSSE